MTTNEAIHALRLIQPGNLSDAQKDAIDMAIVALQLQDDNLYLDSVKQSFHIQNAGTINMS